METAAKTFTTRQLTALRTEFGKIEFVHPDSPSLDRIRALLATMSREMLHQVVAASVRWLTYFAKLELKEREAQEWRSFKGTPKGKAFLAARELAKDFGK